MNTVTSSELNAIATADEAQRLVLLPLSRLVIRKTGRNVRKSPRLSIPELAASIFRTGLLQNLIVSPLADGDQYEVVGGGRRLVALKLLVKQRKLPKDWAVPCLVVAGDAARTASLTENVQREAMHPADQFEAFAALVGEGRSIEEVAADFSVTPLVVQRRLKLANVSPRLLADYRADSVSLDQLMALAITDDHVAQEAAFYDAPSWQRHPNALRSRLTEREIEAHRHPLVRFVGLATYEAAGGGVRRDLFAEGDAGVYLNDAALLERLALEQLSRIADEVRAEGWAWVDATPIATYADLQAFQRAPQTARTPTKREAQRMEKLESQVQEIGEAVEAAMEDGDEEKAEGLQEEGNRIVRQLQEIEYGLLEFAPDVKSAAGAIVTVERTGEVSIHRGLLREAEAKALRTLERLRTGLVGGQEGAANEEAATGEAAKQFVMSARLAQRLSTHRTAALQIEVARHPHVALAALVQGMVEKFVLPFHFGDTHPLGVRLTQPAGLETMAPDWADSPAMVALSEMQLGWRDALPADGSQLFTALVAMSQDELVKLLAVCVASTVDVVVQSAGDQQEGVALAEAVGLNMAAWWKPTADGYFKHVPKAVILDGVSEFAPAHAERLAKLKKGDLACEAERLAVGTGWMPAVFKTAGPEVAEAAEATGASEPASNEPSMPLAA